jgi:hypothetical protein
LLRKISGLGKPRGNDATAVSQDRTDMPLPIEIRDKPDKRGWEVLCLDIHKTVIDHLDIACESGAHFSADGAVRANDNQRPTYENRKREAQNERSRQAEMECHAGNYKAREGVGTIDISRLPVSHLVKGPFSSWAGHNK